MKRLSTLLFLLLSLPAAPQARTDSTLTLQAAPPALVVTDDVDELWDEANTAYINADYRTAIDRYHRIESQGLAGAKLFYNLGNAYFRDGKTGRAILYYNKALRLAPGDEDIRYNLEVANSYTKDRIAAVPVFFLKSWMRDVRHSLSGNAWAALSILFFAAMLALVLLFLLTRRLSLRKTGFYGAVTALLLFVATSAMAAHERRETLSPSEGIVMISAAPIKASPQRASTDLFILHEGTKVRVVNRMEGWREIVIADGKKGWVEESAVEMID